MTAVSELTQKPTRRPDTVTPIAKELSPAPKVVDAFRRLQAAAWLFAAGQFAANPIGRRTAVGAIFFSVGRSVRLDRVPGWELLAPLAAIRE